MNERLSLETQISELREAAEIDCTELGEYWNKLLDIHECCDDHCSIQGFRNAVVREIKACHERLVTEFSVVVKTETSTRVVSRLVHESEREED